MIITVDIGNTNICAAVFSDKNEPDIVRSYPDNLFYSSEELAAELKKICPEPDGAVLCSVVPHLTKAVYSALNSICKEDCVVIDSSFRDGLEIKGYDRKRLGNDRIADMVAVKTIYGAPAVVFDMGTATTVSVLNKDAAFIGGMIMPGMGLSINALSSGTALLPGINPHIPRSLLGQDTVSCINNGVIFSQASAVEGIIDRVEKELGEQVNAVVTGGAAKFILPVTRRDVFYDENLLLKGLKILYENR